MTHPLDVFIGKKIRKRREDLGFSLRDLERKTKIAYQQIQRFESGVSRVVCQRLYALGKALEMPVGDFFEGYKEKQAEEQITLNLAGLSEQQQQIVANAVSQLVSTLGATEDFKQHAIK